MSDLYNIQKIGYKRELYKRDSLKYIKRFLKVIRVKVCWKNYLVKKLMKKKTNATFPYHQTITNNQKNKRLNFTGLGILEITGFRTPNFPRSLLDLNSCYSDYVFMSDIGDFPQDVINRPGVAGAVL